MANLARRSLTRNFEIPPPQAGEQDFLQSTSGELWDAVGLIRKRPGGWTVWRFDRPPFRSSGYRLGTFDDLEVAQSVLVKSLNA